MSGKNVLLLIDANSIIHRAYHALPNLRTSKGAYTGAIYGFLTIFLRIVKELSPTHVAAAFDLKAPTFRHKLYPPYKATRKPMDAELAEQFEPLKELLALMKVPVVSKEGYEADDILGTLSAHAEEETVILTGDRDSFQLVSPTTRIYWTKKGVSDVEIVDLDRLAADGFTPQSFIDFKALRGDPSDNIPGVPGVGEKTARSLLEQYKTLDEVLDHANEVKGKLGESLAAGREIALLSRTLATIEKNVPLDVTEEDLRFSGEYSQEVQRRLQELELNSVAARLKFSDAEGAPARNVDKTVVEVKSAEEIDALKGGEKVAVLIAEKVSFAFDADTEYVISCAEDLFSDGILFDDAVEEVKKLAASRTLVCYDFKALKKKYGFSSEGYFDVMVAAHLTRGSAPIKSVEAVLGAEGYDIGAAELFAYADDAAKAIEEQGLSKLFYEVEQPLIPVLAAMEERGVAVAQDRLADLKVKYEAKLAELTETIYSETDIKFNIASPKQLGDVLFERLGLKHGKKTKTGWSVSEEVLSGLIDAHPVIGHILEWRHYAKLLGTYVAGMQPLINRGRIHTEFNQCITATGRLSSTNPNLQNIPARGEEARDIKSAFVASEGCVLVSADYSQIELRMLAHLSGDEKLIEAYNNAEDIHALTASKILGIPQSEVTSAQRRDAKAVNFGIIYGMSDFGLSENLSIPVYRAKEFIERYFATYPKVKAYMDSNVAFARDHGYSETMLGRRRNLREITSSNRVLRQAAERMAMNTPLQGSAAEIVKLAMLAVERRLAGMKSKMILQIHDELVVDAAEEEKEEVVRILKEEMESAVSLRVPLIVEVGAAKNLGELK